MKFCLDFDTQANEKLSQEARYLGFEAEDYLRFVFATTHLLKESFAQKRFIRIESKGQKPEPFPLEELIAYHGGNFFSDLPDDIGPVPTGEALLRLLNGEKFSAVSDTGKHTQFLISDETAALIKADSDFFGFISPMACVAFSINVARAIKNIIYADQSLTTYDRHMLDKEVIDLYELVRNFGGDPTLRINRPKPIIAEARPQRNQQNPLPPLAGN